MSIDPQMEKVVTYLVEMQSNVFDAAKGNQDRPWLDFRSVEIIGKFDFDKIHDAFTRNASNNEYTRIKAQKDTKSKDIMTAKLSADFLAGCERDFRMRTRSRVRTLIHGGVVSPQAMGSDKGPIRRNTVDWMSRILEEDSDA